MTRNSIREDGPPAPELADYYARRADNGIGLIIVESAAIGEKSAASYVGGLQVHSPKHAGAWRPITCGEIKSRERAEFLLNSGHTDQVAFDRPLIANPGWTQMLETGYISEYVEFDYAVHSAELIRNDSTGFF